MSRRPQLPRSVTRRLAALTTGLLVVGVAVAAPAVADAQPTVTVTDATVTEGDAGTTTAVFTVSLTRSSPNRTTIAYNTSDSSARAPGDYAYTAGQLVFAPGATSKTIAVDVAGDTRFEVDEVFYLYLSSPSGAPVTDNTAVGTIVDDDPRPYVSVGNATVAEGNSGTVTATFPVTLDRPSAQPVRVRYDATNGSAAAGADFAATHGTLVIPAGQTAASIAVPVTGDTLDEGNTEYFYVGLSAPVGALVVGSAANGIIVDDDGTPLLSALDSAVVEGNSGTTSMVFTLKLSSPSPSTVTAFFATSDGTAGSADYTPRVGALSFTPGQTVRTVSVTVKGDTADESTSEYLNLGISDVVGAAVWDGSAFGEIVDDDPALSASSFLTVDTASATEPDTGQVLSTFTVALQPASSSTVTVNYATSPSSADAGTDYTTTNGTLTFAPGATSATVKVPVRGDDVMEGDEVFNLSLSGAVNAVIDDGAAYGVILNDDVAPVASISDVSVVEGATGTTGDAALEIRLSAPSAATASLVYTTANSNAQAPGDYTTVNATVVFQPGETSKVVHIPTIGDTVDEIDESFYVYLSSPNNVLLTDRYGWVVITDDDRNPSVSIDDPSVFEGTGGSVQGVFTVSLSAPSPNTVTVNYGTGNSSAVTPEDYTAVAGTLTFAPGQTSLTVAVPVQSDTIDENNESFLLYLGSPVNAVLSESSGTLYLFDDDSAPLISITESAAQEKQSGTGTMTFTATLSSPTANTVTVNYATGDGNAVAPGDYTTTAGTLTFAPGETSKPIAVTIVGDTIHENNEYFSLALTSPVNAYLRDGTTYGTIWDTDPLPNLTVTDIGVVEGNTGTTNSVFTVNLSPASPNTVTVSYGTSDGTAVAGDYTTTTGTLTFAPGQTSKTVAVPVIGDTVDENQEYFALSLSGAVNAGIWDNVGYATLFDDDPSGGGSLISIDDVTVVEGNTGTTDAVFPVTISPAPTAPVTVNYRTSNNGAAGDYDYTPTVGALTFATGQTTATVTVPILGDTLDEDDEYFYVSLFSLRGPVTAGDTGAYGVILDDDRSPLVSIGDVAVAEGGTGTVDAAFTVRLSEPSTQPVLVDWDTRDNTAVAPGDYDDDGGTLTFAPGQTSKVVHVDVEGDDLVEGDEVFYVDLSGLRGAVRASSEQTGVGTVIDSDAFAVMGAVTLPGGAGVTGTTLTLSGNQQPTVTTTSAAGGSFGFDDVPDGRYTLTPTASGRVFSPATYTVDVLGGSLTGFTFLSLTNPSVSGRIVDANGNPVPGVTVTRSGNSQPNATTTTNGRGYYGFSSNAAGTYTVKPTASGSSFTPTQKSVTQTATNAVTANFAKA